MARTVKEWVGKTDDTAVPPRVRLRVLKRFGTACGNCQRPIRAGEAWICDHKQALILGGANRENNLWPLAECCCPAKDRADVAEKSATYKAACANYGIRRRSSRWGRLPGGRDTGIKIKIGGGIKKRTTLAQQHRELVDRGRVLS